MPDKSFQFEYKSVTLKVTRFSISGRPHFRVEFSSARAPIVITRATNAEDVKFWTSIPEGRQAEAEGVGKLLEEYLKTNL